MKKIKQEYLQIGDLRVIFMKTGYNQLKSPKNRLILKVNRNAFY